MEFWMFVFCVIPAIAQSITISPNGNSPEVKMAGGMLSDVPLGFVPISSKSSKGTKSDTHSGKNLNTTRLSLNERYRRLIPYMTFYYANDAASPTTEDTKNIEVEKAQIVEAGTFNENQRQPKVIYSSHRHNNIPRYQGNRLTQHNIASANPSRFYYKEVPVLYQNSPKISSNYNPLLLDHNVLDNQDNNFVRFIPKQIKSPSAPFTPINRKPAVSIYNSNDAANVQYYIFEKDPVPKYKLIPYEQTPPIKYVPEIENVDLSKKHPPLNLPKESVYINQRPVRPQYFYDSVNTQPPKTRKPPTIISESYYEKRPTLLVQPVIESGFRPIIGSSILTTESPTYVEAPTLSHEPPLTSDLEQKNGTPLTNSLSLKPVDNAQYQYVEQATQRPEENTPSNTITLADLLNSLQLNKAIPKPITRENIGSSIRTLLQVLTALKATPPQNDVDPPVLSTPKPFEAPVIPAVTTISPVQSTLASESEDTDFHEEPYLAPVQTPSQHLDDYPLSGSTSQRFPLPITSDDEGGTPGRPGVDYPILTVIPPTKFNCKTQRYKGFFADPETRCQVWHYCDLNGGQASFLCPNGTIFSQAGLTCDWWFNVRCASTTQLYVLNESLYKYILPHSPKFPEDYSGPLVDKYLTLKFKEMEEQFKKNKNKQTAKDKVDSNEDDSSENSSEEKDSTVSSTDTSLNSDKSVESDVGRADVVIDSPGTSGNVERLQEK